MNTTNANIDKSKESTSETPSGTAGLGKGIRVDVVRVCGFRGISNVEVTLPRVTVLLGKNNSGKTSVIKALQLALGDYARFLSDEDFYIGEDEKRREEIIIDIRIIATEGEERSTTFLEEWQQAFGKIIQAEADGKQFVAIRTIAKPDKVKSGYYTTERFHLNDWPEKGQWHSTKHLPKNQLRDRLGDSIPFISIDAQRDIHNELNEKSSFVGRVLSGVEYDDRDVAELERMVAEINEEAVERSESLKQLKGHLNALNQSFEGSGRTEITPFPKKIRDLSKRFGIHFGESDGKSFSMEYHGMGTRSWASMLTVSAFVDLLAENHRKEVKPFFPVMAAEEPEAHLHPNAQRTIFDQLQEHTGQVIVSTHSPYLAGMSDLENLRVLVRTPESVQANQLIDGLDEKDIKALKREVMRLRGEVLFSKALVLFEGVTEEQIIPAMFEIYFGKSAYSSGINFVGVGGKNYDPFVQMARSFGIPTCIISDNDRGTKREIERQVARLKQNQSLEITDDNFYCAFISEGNNIERELISVLGLKDEVIEALLRAEPPENEQHAQSKRAELGGMSNGILIERISQQRVKASNAGFLADVILENLNDKPRDALIPKAVIDVFEKLKDWGVVQ